MSRPKHRTASESPGRARAQVKKAFAILGSKLLSRWKSPRILAVTLALLATAAVASPPATGAESGETEGRYGWSDLDRRIRPPAQSAAAMAYDEARGELVLFPGNGGTWLRTGGQWRRAAVDQEPSSRYGATMVYDAARAEVVMFGGYGPNPAGGAAIPRNDTWTWDGSGWSQEQASRSPSPRAFASMVYDRVRQKVVLFGGIGIDDSGTPLRKLGDTWTWDGDTWTRETPSVLPPPRYGAGMAFDEARGEAILFGGAGVGTPNQCTLRPMNICIDLDGQGGDSGDLNDTWAWDGSTWTQRQPANSPEKRGNMGMEYDAVRQRVVLFSGASTGGLFHDTWAWDGTTWTEVTPADQPEARFSPATAFDRSLGQVVLYGGHRITYLGADTWGWDGVTWSSLEIPTPLPRIASAMAYDPVRGAALLFGGIADRTYGDTWTYASDGWRRESPTVTPPARSYASMVTDTGRKEIVLFGGLSQGFDNLADTWVWNGTAWREVTPALPALSPPARQATAMAYDAARQEIVLFGGWNSDADVMLADTWTWDGVEWELELTTSSPPVLKSHAMAYDATRQEIVLFGGTDEGGEIGDQTWTWDGDGWTQEAPAASPPTAAAAPMVYDETAGVVLLFSGLGNQQAGLWAWDGSTWAEIDSGTGPRRRSFSVMTFVPELKGSLLFGGLNQGYRDDTWLWGAVEMIPDPTGSPTPTDSPTATQSPTPEPIPMGTTVSFTESSAESGRYSDVAHLEVRLVDDSGQPVSGANLIFDLAGREGTESFPATTDADGVGAVTVELTGQPGDYNLLVRYGGDDDYEGSANQRIFVIEREITELELTVSGNGSKRTLLALLTDDEGDPLEGAPVVFFAEGARIGEEVTDDAGHASMKAPPRYRGKGADFEARFEGDDFYIRSSGEATGGSPQ